MSGFGIRQPFCDKRRRNGISGGFCAAKTELDVESIFQL